MGIFKKLFGKADADDNTKYTMPDYLMLDITEALKLPIYSGFMSDDELYSECLQTIEDMCIDYEEAIPSEEFSRKLISDIIAQRNSSASSGNNFTRLAKIFDELAADRVAALHNAGYTMDEGFDEVDAILDFMKEHGIPHNGYCFYHGQDLERAVDPDINNLCLAFGTTDGDLEKTLQLGRKITELLKNNGFEVQWDGSADSRIMINDFHWDKIYDGTDYSPNRIIKIMQNNSSANSI